MIAVGNRLLARPEVETAYLAFEPAPPPVDLEPNTPDFTELQGYLGPGPDGLDFREAPAWEGGTGEGVILADLEYSWDPEHEDLEATVGVQTWGWDSEYYRYHGNSVLGELFAQDNGYGVTGMAPDALPMVISPYTPDRAYSLPDAIEAAAALLEPGDVLLVEQQTYAGGAYAPVEADPATWDAIALAVAKGIVVVEPGANGAADLDDPDWEGWFDRTQRDSGAIMVGGGCSPLHPTCPARSWYPYGSSTGSRVDVQGWYDRIVTATTGEYNGGLADLFFPEGDSRQAYTESFGGTSGASPMIAAAAAVAQAVALARWGAPWDPLDLRQALVESGWPQPEADAAEHPIGPMPDLARLLRSWGLR